VGGQKKFSLAPLAKLYPPPSQPLRRPWALAATIALVGQVEGLVGEFPKHFVW